MVERIGQQGGALARESIRAAMDAQARTAERVRGAADGIAPSPPGTEAAGSTGFAAELDDGLRTVARVVSRATELPEDFVAGKVEDFHEVAVQLKRADLSFRFALEIRNKLIDAYREVMRMSV